MKPELQWLVTLAAASMGCLAAWLYPRLPARWLCDYGETPQPHHSATARKASVWRYALLAGFCALTVLGAARSFAANPRGLAAALLFAALLAVLALAAVCDAAYTILPDELLLAALLLAAGIWALRAAAWHPQWHSAPVGAAAGFLGLWAVQWLTAHLYHTQAMGFGDVKLLGVLGLLCGGGGLAAGVLFAVLCAGLVLLALLARKRITRRSMVPFGPFLVFGAACATALWPEWHRALAWYLGLFW